MSVFLLRAIRIMVGIVGVAILIFLLLDTQNAEVVAIIESHRFEGAILVSLIMFGTTIIAPLTSLPLIPVVAPLLGPFVTGVACFVGWFLGALVAFYLGRKYGKSILMRTVSFESIIKYESYIKPEMEFVTILALRMLIPVDVLSYFLGAMSRVSFRVHAGATAIGIAWFSFGFAYFGRALVDHHYVLLASISVASVVVLYSAWRYLQKMKQK